MNVNAKQSILLNTIMNDVIIEGERE